MTHPDDLADPRADSTSSPEVPPGLLRHDTGLSPERLRALLAAEDAYTRRQDERRRGQE